MLILRKKKHKTRFLQPYFQFQLDSMDSSSLLRYHLNKKLQLLDNMFTSLARKFTMSSSC